jgi:UDP-N-acetylmuramate: L-alanyl-gamma-D-glutamyl-meso-diaminopimelate ligase
LTSIEFDHADIYEDLEHCQRSFRQLMAIMPTDGCVVARWDHDAVAEVAREVGCELRRYGPGQDWDGRIDSVDTVAGTMTFTVLHEGRPFGTFTSIMVGEHNLYNQVAVVAALAREGLTAAELAVGFASFQGIKRRQEVIGEVGKVTVLDDFAHHPTAVKVTLSALRLRFGGRRIWAIFEPRSNTSRRAIFQQQFSVAFDDADIIVIAPPYDQSRISVEDRLNPRALVDAIRARGNEAYLWGEQPEGLEDWSPQRSARVIAAQIAANAQPEDVIAILSNGGFGGLHRTLLADLGQRFIL